MDNYNMSSTGIQIVCNTFLDNEMSQINFNENIDRLDNFNQDLFIYTDYGNIETELGYNPKNIGIDDLYKFNESRLDQVKFYKHLIRELGYCYSDIKESSIKDLCDEHLAYSDLDNLDLLISSSNIGYDILYEKISVTGYSQGDYAEVIILTKLLKKVWGYKEVDINSLKSEITHYFYDTPMRIRCDVNGEEYISESMDGCYMEYNKDNFIEEILNNFKELDQDILKSELDDVLPLELDYV